MPRYLYLLSDSSRDRDVKEGGQQLIMIHHVISTIKIIPGIMMNNNRSNIQFA